MLFLANCGADVLKLDAASFIWVCRRDAIDGCKSEEELTSLTSFVPHAYRNAWVSLNCYVLIMCPSCVLSLYARVLTSSFD